MSRDAVSIKEVAVRSGVSVGTVSNVLNRPDAVSDTTRRAVLAAIEELGFVRNGSASRLRSTRSHAVGLVVHDIANPFFADMARGAEQALELRGYTVMLCNADGSQERQRRHLRFLEEQRVAGVLITPVDPSSDRRELSRLQKRGLSIVLVDEEAENERSCSVSVDDVRGGELAGEHLLEIGRRRIVYVAGPDTSRQCRDRGAGLQRVIDSTAGGGATLQMVRVPALNGRAGHAAVPEILALEPDAVFCANDVVALGVLRGLFEAGRSVPDEIALIGYDDIEFAQLAAVPLTSIRQPAAQMGEAAAGLLVDECAGTPGHVHQRIAFRPELIRRRSTLAEANAKPRLA